MRGTPTKALAALVLLAAAAGILSLGFSDRLLIPGLAFGVCLVVAGVLLLRGEPAPVEVAPAEPEPAAEGPGLAAYDLIELLGSGSMGELWKGRHKLLDRPVALKRIKATVIEDEDIGRFKREARATSELRSPHTVEVYDFGEDAGALFYAMECLEGIDLQRLIARDGAMPPARAINILQQACHSLAEAHAHGIVHRDIKPANLMLCRYGLDYDFVKLLDFGLAKAVKRESHAGLTRDGIVLGTAAYIAPESLKGSRSVDGRADLYALGAVAFWLVTGRLVFLQDQPLAMVRAHLSETPPSVASVSRFAIPPAFDELVAACLAKDPDARPQTAAELRRRLLAIETSDSWTERDARDWWSQAPQRT